jgi:hypothetical protein
VLGATTISTLVVIMTTLGDWVTSILAYYFQILTIVIFDTLGEAKLTWVWWCPIMWLPIGILCGAECGCEYTSGALLLNWMDGRICRLYGPNWPPNSMPQSILDYKIPSSSSCDWSTNALPHFVTPHV